MKTVRCVAFDLDDTLYLEREYVRSGFQAVDAWLLASRGIGGFAPLAWRAFRSGARGSTFDVVLRALGLNAGAGLIREMVDVYRNHSPNISLLGDATVALEATMLAGVVAIITDGPLVSQRNKIAVLNLRRWASTIIVTAEFGESWAKPATAAFREVQQRHALPGDACTYVADNPSKDFVAPRELGWRTLRVRRPGGLHFAVPSGDDVDEELAELTELTNSR